MKAFCNDLRVRVIRAKSAGHSVKDIASHLQVSQRWIYTILKRYRETGKYEALPIPGAKRKLCEDDVTRLLELIKQHPDATLSELKDKGNFCVSIPTLHRTLIRAGITYKKRPLERANKTVKM